MMTNKQRKSAPRRRATRLEKIEYMLAEACGELDHLGLEVDDDNDEELSDFLGDVYDTIYGAMCELANKRIDEERVEEQARLVALAAAQEEEFFKSG